MLQNLMAVAIAFCCRTGWPRENGTLSEATLLTEWASGDAARMVSVRSEVLELEVKTDVVHPFKDSCEVLRRRQLATLATHLTWSEERFEVSTSFAQPPAWWRCLERQVPKRNPRRKSRLAFQEGYVLSAMR
jgi:hypothetical protein